VLGGLLTLVLLFSARLRAAISWARAAAVSSLPVPYGAAIAVAAVIVTLPPNLS
jgi:Flp pilus assembly protein protease CpaA